MASARRRAAILVPVLAGTAVLAGCQKPVPEITLIHGSTSFQASPACYSRAGQLSQEEFRSCLENSKPSGTVKARAGDRIGIGVDPKTAEQGWGAILGGQSVLLDIPSSRTFSTFVVPPELRKDIAAELIVIETGPSTDTIKGAWKILITGK
jgi:hypothetical protein